MDAGRVDPRTQAALDLAGTYVFGTEPGRIPVVLFEAYQASAANLDRAVLGAALARCWAYAGEHARAAPFAVAAVRHAEATGDSGVLAGALDASLVTHWGPDELDVRVDLAGRLADVAAHLGDAEARLKAHLWLLTVAAETLTVSELNRQVRALERLGEESRKALFFAASRRLMLDLMRGRSDTITPLLALAHETAPELPDGDLVVRALTTYSAVQTGDRSDAVLAAAREGEAIAEQEGIREVIAEVAWIYLGLGLTDDARRLALTFDTRALGGLPRDHNYLLTLQLLLDVALGACLDDQVETITPLLLPYAGRAVINAGAVMFHGVTDDTLARACARLGDVEPAGALRASALATYRRIGAVWWRERLEAFTPTAPAAEQSTVMTLRPGQAGVWFVGRGTAESAIPARRGFEHLYALLTHPGKDIPALRLAGGVETVEQAGLGEVVDAHALQAYRRRLAEIDTELDDADDRGDAPRSTALTAERQALLAQVSAATGLGSRPRTSGSGAERARTTVRKAVAAALDAIHSADPVIARHLTTHVHTGLTCRYEPDPDAPVHWRL
jgi:hypothetical protein